jgi:8-oxo-dGTP pyrophosphatase MutT (NUDIX family)
MTSAEKILIRTCNFNAMFFQYWLMDPDTQIVSPDDLAKFNEKKNKFLVNFFNPDRGKRLIQLLTETSYISLLTLYEFPKGHSMHGETPLDAAKRETIEETGIGEDAYEILSSESIKHEFTGQDDKKKYIRYYFFAEMKNPRTHTMVNHRSKTQRLEVDEIIWMSLSVLEENMPIYSIVYSHIRSHAVNRAFQEASWGEV